MDLQKLRAWAISMFCGGRENVVLKAGDPFVDTVTVQLTSSIRAVVTALFHDFVDRICSSPERPDLRLAEEEALGHLAGSLVVGELLPEEARRVGKRVDYYAAQEKKTAEKAKESARQKKKALRKKKGADQDLELEEKCRQLDEAAATAQSMRLAKEAAVGLPARSTSIVATRQPAAAPAPAATATRTKYRHPWGGWVGDSPATMVWRFVPDTIPGYRGLPGVEGELYWDPRAPPCVPSDSRPPHLFGSQEAADAAGMAARVEIFRKPVDYDSDNWENSHYDEDNDEMAHLEYKQALRRLLRKFPELGPCPIAHASQHDTRPCPCGRGVLAKWPWVVQVAEQGFCDSQCCDAACWELICWRSEWGGEW